MASASGETYREYTLLDYLVVARKRWLWIVGSVLAFAGLAYLYSVSQAERFEATASVLVSDTAAQRTLDPTSQNAGFLNRELSNEVSLASSDQVESLVEAALGELPDVTITSEADADVLVFTASAASADQAPIDANTWAEKYIEVKQDQVARNIAAATVSLRELLEELRVERQALRQPLDDLDEQISRTTDEAVAARLQRDYDRLANDLQYELQLVTDQASSASSSLTELRLQGGLSTVGGARQIEVAVPPDTPSNLPLSRLLIAGIVVGLAVGAALALLAEVRDNTIKSAGDVQAITDIPVLASVPEATKRERAELGIATYRDPEGVFADSYHKIRSSIEFLSFETDINSVMVTSANPSEGKSTSSANLALAMTSVGRRTVLLDLDFRRATIHKIFNIRQTPGLSDFVLHEADLSSVAYAIKEPGLDNLLVVPTGSIPPSPASFVGTSSFLDTIGWFQSEADIVLLDTPPLLAASHAYSLGRYVDAVILTARAGSTTKAQLTEVIRGMRQVGANVVGVVLIGVEDADSYGKYYYADEAPPTKREAKSANRRGTLWGDGGSRVSQPTNV